jgi:RimJ/RimL family protein N-acetyltransferase
MSSGTALATQLLRAIDDEDWAGVAALFADDAEYRSPSGHVCHGRNAIERYYRQERAVAGIHRIEQVWSQGPWIAVSGEFSGTTPAGQRQCLHFLDRLRIEAGRIVEREVLTTDGAGSGLVVILTTPRLKLRPFALTDAADLARVAGHRSIADTTVTVPHPLDVEGARAWIINDLARCLHDQHMFAVEARDSGRFVGCVGLRHIEAAHGQGELTFWFAAEVRGKGYASEAGTAVIDHAFRTLGLTRLVAHFMTRNPASGRVLTKLGFAAEGLMRRRVRKWGVFEDVDLWALLA